MEAIYTIVGTSITAILLAAGSLFSTPAVQDEPKQDTQVVVTVCGSGGLVPQGTETKCEDK